MKKLEILERHPHWQEILQIIRVLSQEDHTVYLAGGCVRDALLGRMASDIDIATSATPDQVLELFPHGLEIGKVFGVIIVPFVNFQVEIATFRSDGAYVDGRRPESVQLTGPREDAERRDFTVNALFYDPLSGKVIDFVRGLEDLNSRILRAVGDARMRFTEDKLRVLRAIRLSHQLGFEIEGRTLAAIQDLAPEVQVISKERVTAEFKKILKCSNPHLAWQKLVDTKLWQNLLSKLPIWDSSGWQNFLRAQASIAAAHSFTGFIAHIILFSGTATLDERSNWPFVFTRDEKKEVIFLLNGFYIFLNSPDEAMLLLDDDRGPLLSEFTLSLEFAGRLPSGRTALIIGDFLKVANQKGELPEPYLNGHDIISLGVKPSEDFKKILRQVYMAQIKGEVKNKSQAQDWVLLRLQS